MRHGRVHGLASGLALAWLLVGPMAMAAPLDPVVRQGRIWSCGAAAMATLLTYHLRDPVSENAMLHELLRNKTEVEVSSAGGFSLLDLKRVAVARGYVVKGYRDLEAVELDRVAPAIVPLDLPGGRHFVVFRGIEGTKVVLGDPEAGTSTLSAARFKQLWIGGIAMVVEKADGTGSGALYHAGLGDYAAPSSPYELPGGVGTAAPAP